MFNELFITPIRGLYADCAITIDEFKERNSALLKDKWVDTRHGENGQKIYQLFDPTVEGDLVKESLQEWLCDNRNEVTHCIGITLRNHEMTYADWFRYVEAKSGPDELALYSLSRKHGIHTAVFNKSYVWTTLSEHLHRTDDEIFKLCGVTLLFLSPTVYGIIKKIRTPDRSQQTASTSRTTTNTKAPKSGKVTCRSSSGASKRGSSSCSKGRGRGRGKTARTLSDSREENFGIPPATIPRTSRRTRATIDYLSLNDGLDEEQPTSPKRKRRANYRPRSGPSSRRIAAQRLGSPLKTKSTTKPIGELHVETLSGVQTESTTLNGIPETSLTDTQPHSAALSGIPSKAPSLNDELVSVPTPMTSTTETALSGVQTDIPSTIPLAKTGETGEVDRLPDLVVNSQKTVSTGDVDIGSQALETEDIAAAAVLLSLHENVRDDTLDEDEEDNATLMPIGGAGAIPEDVAPQQILLDQVNVDAAIGHMLQNEDLEQDFNLDNAPPKLPEDKKKPQTIDNSEEKEKENEKGKGNKEKEKPSNKNVKGTLRTKSYGLKKKPDVNRTFKCSVCNVVKSSVQKLNAHYRRRHPPQMCGICGRTFELASSLSRHMYDHQEQLFKCDRCGETYHFESELNAHKIKHRKNPSYQCMKSKCGKWFKRKWELTIHLEVHSKTRHECDYEGCTFWTKTKKQLKEHQRSHSDDRTHICKVCDKGFKYRSGLKRHRDKDHQDN